ncbi:MAG: WGR domain-containing protein [Pseudoprimorskyibacter sp.]|nr:WGR domain-containing protein [Pseudoprimorskyibacter sp.]
MKTDCLALGFTVGHFQPPSGCNHEANQYRFYRLEIVLWFFGDFGIVRDWGRTGRSVQVRTDWFVTEAEAKVSVWSGRSGEVVLFFRPVCSVVKMDQGFI